MRPVAAPTLTIDDARRQALARAQAGELLTPADMQHIFRLSRSRFFGLQKAGAFEPFKVKHHIGTARYSGFLVYEHLMGRDAAPPRVFAGTRRR